jgi:hypothetical protein
MADVKISALPVAGAIVPSTNVLPVVNGGITTKATVNTIVNAALPTVSANVVPTVDNTYTLGTPSLRWNGVYIGPGSLFLQDTNNAALNVEITVTDGVLLINGTNTMQIGDFIFDQNTIESTVGSTDIEIGLTSSAADILLNRNTVVDASKTFTLGNVQIDNTTNATVSAINNRTLYVLGDSVTVEDNAGGGRLTCNSEGIAINSDATSFTVSPGKAIFNGIDVPARSTGSAGDVTGQVAFDSSYMYYCIADYNPSGLSNIWRRVAWDTRPW